MNQNKNKEQQKNKTKTENPFHVNSFMAPCDKCARKEEFCWNVKELFCQKRDTWNGPKNVTIVTLPFILRIFLKEIKKVVVIKEKH